MYKDTLSTINLNEEDLSKTALFCVDMINGFCKDGNLYSDRIHNIINPIRDLIIKLDRKCLKWIYFIGDFHSENDEEFKYFPPHCIIGTDETNLVKEIEDIELNKANSERIYKNTTNLSFFAFQPILRTLLSDGIKNIIIVGCCTDICVYQLAVNTKTQRNFIEYGVNVIVPENCVATFDSNTHPGDLLHDIFLYHMSLNGIKVVSEIKV